LADFFGGELLIVVSLHSTGISQHQITTFQMGN